MTQDFLDHLQGSRETCWYEVSADGGFVDVTVAAVFVVVVAAAAVAAGHVVAVVVAAVKGVHPPARHQMASEFFFQAVESADHHDSRSLPAFVPS